MANQRINGVVLALAAGFLVSRYLTPAIAFAQAPPVAPKEIRAQNFVLVNDKGSPVGLFGFDPQGRPLIKLIAENGQTIWSSDRPLAPYSGPIPPVPPPPPLRKPTPQK